MKKTLQQQLVSLNRSRASLILKHLYSDFEELKELRQLSELKPGLCTLRRALATFSVALQ
jgi:hypothetical protein